jgi:hypothetical protein
MGDVDGAAAALDAVLQANPDHLDARRLRADVGEAELPAGPGGPAHAADGPAGADGPAPPARAPAGHAAPQPRKAVTQGRSP